MKRPSIHVMLGALVASIFVALTMVTPAFADYGYTIRVFPGNRGTLSENPVSVTVSKGDTVDLYSIATATITDDRYIQTGFRQSGTDTLLGNGVINGVTEDMDFVVAYGVEANTVSYTLQFVEYETGKELAPSKTYFGREGDKPVAAYEYIEGYRPRYLAITGTLHGDEENVWTFEYIPLAEGETIVTTTTNTTTTYVTGPATTQTVTTTEGGTTTTSGGTTTTGGTTQGGAANQGNAEGGATANANQGEGGTAAGNEGGAEESEPETQEILDLDTPLAGPDSGGTAASVAEKSSHLLTNPVAIAGIATAIVGALGVLLYLANRKKKDQQNEEA